MPPEEDDEQPIGPPRWGPASWWRMGIAFFGLLVAVLLVYRLFFE